MSWYENFQDQAESLEFARELSELIHDHLGNGDTDFGPPFAKQIEVASPEGSPEFSAEQSELGWNNVHFDSLVLTAIEPPTWGDRLATLVPQAWLDDDSTPLPEWIVAYANFDDENESWTIDDLRSGREWPLRHHPLLPMDIVEAALLSLEGEEVEELERLLNAPILVGKIVGDDDIEKIPLLVGTFKQLEKISENRHELSEFLSQSTGLELFRQTKSIKATLDVLITLPHWIEEVADGEYRVIPQQGADTVKELISLAVRRHVMPTYVPHDELTESHETAIAFLAGHGLSAYGLLSSGVFGLAFPGAKFDLLGRCEDAQVAHQEWRRWKLPESMQSLRKIAEEIERNEVALSRKVNAFFVLVNYSPEEPSEAAERLLRWFAGSPDWRTSIQRGSQRLGITREQVLSRVREMSDFGWVLKDELDADLQREFSTVSAEDRQISMLVAATLESLPYGYLFYRSREVNKVVSAVQRMLSWQSPVRFEDIHSGLQRVAGGRSYVGLAPLEVVIETIKSFEEFRCEGGVVHRTAELEKPENTIISWLLRQLDEEPDGTLHRNEIMGRAVANGYKPSTIAMYLQFAPEIAPLGRNCFGIAGRRVDESSIASHQAIGHAISSSTEIIDQTDLGTRIELRLVVGTDLQNSGQISMSKKLVSRIGGRSLQIVNDGKTFGHLKFNGPSVYGFLTVLQHLGALSGDLVDINLDFVNGQAVVTRGVLSF